MCHEVDIWRRLPETSNILTNSLRQMQQLMAEGLPEVDKKYFKHMLEDPTAISQFVEAVRESLRESSWGMVWDSRPYGRDWAFALNEVDASGLVVWSGELDANVLLAWRIKLLGICSRLFMPMFKDKVMLASVLDAKTMCLQVCLCSSKYRFVFCQDMRQIHPTSYDDPSE